MLQDDAARLLTWYEKGARPLPWRRNVDPYPVWVSETMLQQTTVAAVIPKFELWMNLFPTVEALARTSLESVFAAWSGLGYYQRARRLHRAAKEIVGLGHFPSTSEKLRALPGFGPYTAAAVASICFAEPILAIDTNVTRVLYRYYALRKTVSDRQAHRELQENVSSVLGWARPGDFNQALMELGSSLCSIREPRCAQCPLRVGCRARALPLGVANIPQAKTKKIVRTTPGVALVLQNKDDSSFLLVKGTAIGVLKDLYQPPLLFTDSALRDPYHQGLRSGLGFFEKRVPDDSWSLRYGISGRTLLLECRHFLLEPKSINSLVGELNRGSVTSLFWSDDPALRTHKSSVAVSSLTRRILQSRRGNP